MKTSVIEVHGMLSALSADGVEKRIRKVPGVESVTVNDAAGNATVRYDEALLEIADIKAAVHQSEYQSADQPETRHASEHAPAAKRAVSKPEATPPPASTPVTEVPNAAPAVATAPAKPAAAGHEGHAATGAQPAASVATAPKVAPVVPAAVLVPAPVDPAVEATPDAKASAPATVVPKVAPTAPTPAVPAATGHEGHKAADTKPPTPVSAVPKAAAVAPGAAPAPEKKSAILAASEPRADSWLVPALSLATTLGVAYISCAIFDMLFPPFGLLAALASASPLPISGSPLGFLTGFGMFTVAGFVLGALHGVSSALWSRILR